MDRISIVVLFAVGAAALTACSKYDGNSAVALDMNSEGSAGHVSISVPGFNAKVNVPVGMMGHGDFDIDGVKLYPDSKVTTFNLNVDGNENGAKNGERTVIKLSFAAPADVSRVTSWYKTQFAGKSVSVAQTAAGLSGKTKDGDEFTIALAPGAPGHTIGAITLLDAKK